MNYMGLPAYASWDKIPSGLVTKTRLAQEHLVPGPTAQPIAYKKSTCPVRYFALYRRSEAVPMPPRRVYHPRDYAALFCQRYTSKRRAYLEASQMCFELNRYAKHERCRDAHRKDIYALKAAWIELLYEQGFCREASRVRTPIRDLACRCGDGCERCNYTGIYRTVGGREYWSFVFVVDGKTFAWHQPAPLAFDARETRVAREHLVLPEEQPVTLPTHRFAEAKALLRWCIDDK